MWAVSVVVAAALGAVVALPLAHRLTPDPVGPGPMLAITSAVKTDPIAAVAAQNLTAQVATPSHPVVSTYRQADGLFYITAPVNGQPVRFIIDTGASVVVLSKADALRTGVLTGPVILATTANGTSDMRRATIQNFELAGRRMQSVPAIIALSGDVSLIGQNVLGRMASLSIEGDQMRLR
jgi:aspartyl protease family protein